MAPVSLLQDHLRPDRRQIRGRNPFPRCNSIFTTRSIETSSKLPSQRSFEGFAHPQKECLEHPPNMSTLSPAPPPPPQCLQVLQIIRYCCQVLEDALPWIRTMVPGSTMWMGSRVGALRWDHAPHGGAGERQGHLPMACRVFAWACKPFWF